MRYEFAIIMEQTAIQLPPLLTQKSAEGWELVQLIPTGRVRTETWDVLMKREVKQS